MKKIKFVMECEFEYMINDTSAYITENPAATLEELIEHIERVKDCVCELGEVTSARLHFSDEDAVGV